jgi:hypothetical protein
VLAPLSFSHVRPGGTGTRGEQCAPHVGFRGSQDAGARQSHQRVARGRGPRSGKEGGGDMLPKLGPQRLPGDDGVGTRRKGGGGGQGQSPGRRQDHGRMVPKPAGRRIGLLFQLLCLPKPFVTCVYITCYASLLHVVVDLSGSLAQGPKKISLKTSCS